MSIKSLTSIFAACLLLSSPVILASGYQLYSESAADVLGIGGAGVAREGHASSAWYNPAATTSIDQTIFTGGGSFIKLQSEYKSPLGKDNMEDKIRITGYFYAVHPINQDMRLTLSVNAPYGMITQWKSKSQLSNLATFTSIRVCYISPGIAYKLTDDLSIALGANLAIGVARLANYIDLSAAGLPRNKLYMRADGYGFGGFASLFWKPLDDWAFGIHYQSQVELKLTGDASYRTPMKTNLGVLNFIHGDVDTTLRLPAYLSLGVENTSFRNLRLMADAVWTQWSLYRSMDISFENYPSTGRKGKSVNERNWRDVWAFHLGAEYQLTDQWVLRAGYMHDLNPSNNYTRSPEMPEAEKRFFALGCGYQRERWGIDLAYAFVLFNDARLGHNPARYLKLEDRGTFHTRCQILSLQLTLKF